MVDTLGEISVPNHPASHIREKSPSEILEHLASSYTQYPPLIRKTVGSSWELPSFGNSVKVGGEEVRVDPITNLAYIPDNLEAQLIREHFDDIRRPVALGLGTATASMIREVWKEQAQPLKASEYKIAAPGPLRTVMSREPLVKPYIILTPSALDERGLLRYFDIAFGNMNGDLLSINKAFGEINRLARQNPNYGALHLNPEEFPFHPMLANNFVITGHGDFYRIDTTHLK